MSDVTTDRRSCVFTAMSQDESGPTTSDKSPAAAAAGSRCPMFDFKDAHWTSAPRGRDFVSTRSWPAFLQSALVAAPT